MTVLSRQRWAYLDGNAVSRLWDWHTTVTDQGQTGDPRSSSPFEEAVLSEYSLAELVTTTNDNALKKHLVLLTIFPDIPVLRCIEGLDLRQIETDRDLLLLPTTFLRNLTGLRLAAMAGHSEAAAALTQDLAHLKGGLITTLRSGRRMHRSKTGWSLSQQ